MHSKFFANLFSLTILTAISSACVSAEPDKLGLVHITGFRSGLVEFDASQRPRIYKEGNVFPYEINGTCAERVNDFETPGCMDLVSKDCDCSWRRSPVLVG
jgi:hypothetical protein